MSFPRGIPLTNKISGRPGFKTVAPYCLIALYLFMGLLIGWLFGLLVDLYRYFILVSGI